ncbi:BRCA1 BRCA2-containing complex, subunit 3 [Dimargaris verticillata]|uniref:BRCA1 BRCA2-containing complex, subunit 3 n=1 Tax=Dimargaris verticillata TaxID=2761393 RepID=A0A9W8B3Y3_9FUNG|nr:BRCA1 BRCA2-containing complex, subunit 3 [Dimargaris verticillata]
MGLMLGEWQTTDDDATVAYVTELALLRRSDKQRDRVEISPEQLHLAAVQADQRAAELNRPIRVIGWYHSHPHITVHPSDVDLATQHRQQQLDQRFFGAIVACYNDGADKAHQMRLTCFQARQSTSDAR